jgi:hypothetical protein
MAWNAMRCEVAGGGGEASGGGMGVGRPSRDEPEKREREAARRGGRASGYCHEVTGGQWLVASGWGWGRGARARARARWPDIPEYQIPDTRYQIA